MSRTPPCPGKRRLGPRATALLVVLASGGLFAIAGGLSPSESGMGTHTALGMPPCSVPMLSGYPCPTCGMTTSFAYFVRGRLLASFHAQPGGFVIAASLAGALFGACWTLVTGRPALREQAVGLRGTAGRLRIAVRLATPARVTLVAFGVILGGWLYKIAIGVLTGALPLRG